MNNYDETFHESVLADHFGDSGFHIKEVEGDPEEFNPEEEGLQKIESLFIADNPGLDEGDSEFADYVRKFKERFCKEITLTSLWD